MRIPISVQLALLVLSTSLVGLTVISVATWVNNYNFVIGVKSEGLSLTASLKAGEVASDLRLLQAKCSSIATRVLVQGALQRFYAGNTSDANWVDASTDISQALGSGGYFDLYQATVYSRNGQGNPHGLINVTGGNAPGVALPHSNPNGSKVMLGDPGLGYPPMLYPNLTYTSIAGQTAANDSNTAVYAFPDYPLTPKSVLLLGPLQINDTLALLSFTLPIINNTSATELLGFMTVVASATSIQDTLRSQQNLDSSAIVLLLGPARPDNIFAPNAQPATGPSGTPDTEALAAAQVRYVFDPTPFSGQADRHPLYNKNPSASFQLGAYPAALAAFSRPNPKINNASSNLSTKNEQNFDVAVGVARPQGSLADWVLIVEENHSDAWQPVQQLRNIILACVFGTAGFIALVVLPLAHFSVTPIRRLKSATEKTIQPSMMDDGGPSSETPAESVVPDEKGNWIVERMRTIRQSSWRKPNDAGANDGRPKQFRVPCKVRERKHIVTDELTELTSTFNEMADELMIQYTRLEERVAERTRELELSKKAAEMANESKTLFIANISHELKTPLNGILGMCAVCMGEDDLPRIKKSLQVVYKSGDLLLHLLNDLLTFSRNQIDQAIRLDEKEFSLSDIRSQLVTIFEKQVREKHIQFDVTFIGVNGSPPNGDPGAENPAARLMPALGPLGTGRLRDMILWGDQHRILQILINLVSNSLKFTPDGGRVNVRIRCLGDVEKRPESSMKGSVNSKRASYRRSQTPSRTNSKSEDARPSGGALDPKFGQIGPHPQPDGWRTPPPINFRPLAFEFQVEDTGHGIPEHLQQRVFEPFVQGDLGLNRKYGGTGLGLSICSQLSRLMGGSIALDSTEGKGTIFTLIVPLKFIKEKSPSTRSSSVGESARSSISIEDPHNVLRPPSSGGPSTGPLKAFEQVSQPRLVGLSQPFFTRAPPTSSGVNSTLDAKVQSLDQANSPEDASGKIRVLVAEDNVVNQEVVLRMLKLEDIYDVTVAKDGQEAYDTVKANMEQGKKFDLIFMDIQMPNLDGLQSTRLIRQMGYSAPIVALSAFAEESNIKDCIDSGMNMFLSKPIRRPALKQVLNKFATIIEEPETPPI